MRIAIDLDSTAMDFMGHWRKHYEADFGHYPSDEHDHRYYQLSSSTVFETENDFWQWYEAKVAFRDVDWLPGAVKAISRLYKANHDVTFVTARPSFGWINTRLQVERHFPGARTIFSAQFGTKAMAAMTVFGNEMPDLWVEDNPGEIMALMGVRHIYPWKVVVFDQPWNREIQGTDRIRRWKEIKSVIGGS